ncbi:hypothetical protein V8C86DRAFT_2550409 [Haematococcus lacustris]
MQAAIIQQQESQQAAAGGASHGREQQQELLLHKPTWSAKCINTGAPATVLQLPAEPGLTVSAHGATHLPSNPSAPAACSATPDSLAQLQLQDHQLELQLQALLAEQRRVRVAMQELLQVAPTDRCCQPLPPPQACLKTSQTAAGAAGDGLVSIVSLDAMLGGHSELLPQLMQPSKAEKERELQDLLYNLEKVTMGRSGKAPPDGLHLRQSPPCTHLTADSPPTCEADEQSEHLNCTAGSKHLHGPQTLSSPQLSLLDTSRRSLDRSSPNLGHTPSQPSTFLLKAPGPCGARACSFELPSSRRPVPARPSHSARTPNSTRQHGLLSYHHSEGRQSTGSRAATEGMGSLFGHWSSSLMGGSSRMARADANLSPGPRLVLGRATAPGAVPDTKAAAKVSSVGNWGDESVLGSDFNGSMGLDPAGSSNNDSTSGPPMSVMTSQWHEELMHQAIEGMHCSPDVDRALRGYARQARLADEANKTRGGVHLSTRDVMRLATWHEEVTLLFADIKSFTSMAAALHPAQVMLFLNHLFNQFDDLLADHDVYKIGDAYFCAGGLMRWVDDNEPDAGAAHALRPNGNTRRRVLGGRDPQHCSKVVAYAKAMMKAANNVINPLGERVQLRIGVHCGPVASGVVGKRMPRFCLFGDTVNTASRCESTGMPSRIHATRAVRDLVPHEAWIPTGGVQAKGKGVMDTYWLDVRN